MLKKLFYLSIFLAMAGGQNLFSMQPQTEYSAGRPIAQRWSKEEELLDKCYSCAKVAKLIKSGANVNTCDQNGETPLIKACGGYLGGTKKSVKRLLSAGADPNLLDRNGVSAHHGRE